MKTEVNGSEGESGVPAPCCVVKATAYTSSSEGAAVGWVWYGLAPSPAISVFTFYTRATRLPREWNTYGWCYICGWSRIYTVISYSCTPELFSNFYVSSSNPNGSLMIEIHEIDFHFCTKCRIGVFFFKFFQSRKGQAL